ncbi:hypothetical protein [Micromonospora maris]|uniref:hypothetical protein n=1 Tax=Micromonospora maris TaxID=1003110 RepID=UPI002E152801|nr:hypothetical protein OG712_05810 [Micromonospora maris]
MDGQQLREALRDEMASVSSPPPLDTQTMLGSARRARNRRRTVRACVGSAAVVVAVAFFGTFAVPGAGGWSPAMIGAPSSEDDTASPWPTGPDGLPQQDRTARAGTRYDRGAELLDQLRAVVPAGYTVPESPEGPSHQAQYEQTVDGVEVWSYSSEVSLAKGEWTGHLLVEVHTAGNQLPTEPCALTRQFWGMQGDCEVVTVAAAQVGVVVSPGDDDRFDQWAAFRHPDGVVVFVAQATDHDSTLQSRTELPFSVPQLASLATNKRFHLQ